MNELYIGTFNLFGNNHGTRFSVSFANEMR